MTPDALTVEQVREGLAAHGIRLDERDSQCSCPVCDGLMALTVTVNGAGAHVECSAGCHTEAILGVVRVGRRMAERGTGHDPLQLVRDRLGLPDLQRITKHGRLGHGYRGHRANGEVIDFGDSATILSQSKLHARLLPQVRALPPWLKSRDEWTAVAVAIEQAAEEFDSVATEGEETRGWLVTWLRQARYPSVDLGDAAALYEMLGSPPPAFMAGARLYVHLSDLVAWVNRFAGARITAQQLSARLAMLDFERAMPSARNGGATRKARYWSSPDGFEVSE